jgi:hypothetical protein
LEEIAVLLLKFSQIIIINFGSKILMFRNLSGIREHVKGEGEISHMEASANGNGERHAYLGRICLVTQAEDDDRLIEASMVTTGAAAAA